MNDNEYIRKAYVVGQARSLAASSIIFGVFTGLGWIPASVGNYPELLFFLVGMLGASVIIMTNLSNLAKTMTPEEIARLTSENNDLSDRLCAAAMQNTWCVCADGTCEDGDILGCKRNSPLADTGQFDE